MQSNEKVLHRGIDEMTPDELRRTVRDLLHTLDSKESALRTARGEISALMQSVLRLQTELEPRRSGK